jgi:hypothetical protein
MPPKKGPSPPIDRPLSKAYLREFVGWSSAHPPGSSEPNSLRVMENVYIDRNGAAAVRPGLKYLSYATAPGTSSHDSPGRGLGMPVVGGCDLFYLSDGGRALLFAVREDDGRVGFRAMLMNREIDPVRTLDDPDVGFTGYTDDTPFSEDTTYVHYVQIDNIIIAMSDNAEPARHFDVGMFKNIRIPKELQSPQWTPEDKLTAVHPDAAWINHSSSSVRRNLIPNSGFVNGTSGWSKAAGTSWRILPGDSPGTPLQHLVLSSAPARTNLMTSPLHDPASTGTHGWEPSAGSTSVQVVGGTVQIADPQSQRFSIESRMLWEGVEEYARYRLALDVETFDGGTAGAGVEFLAVDGAVIGSRIDFQLEDGRPSTPSFRAPKGTVYIRVFLGGETIDGRGYVRVSNVVLCPDGQSTDMFHGGSGDDYFWEGTPNQSVSVHHPPADVVVRGPMIPTITGKPYGLGMSVSSEGGPVQMVASIEYRGGDGALTGIRSSATTDVTDWVTLRVDAPGVAESELFLQPKLIARSLPRGAEALLRSATFEQAATAGGYFNGSSDPGSNLVEFEWEGVPHASVSRATYYSTARPALTAETPTASTLVKTGGAAANTKKMGFFYTFENEVGESAPSQITEIRMQRAWSDWRWETPNAAGEPSGTVTQDPERCADQIVVTIPKTAYERAVRAGALRWHLYAFAWSDQDAVPIEASRAVTKELYPDPADPTSNARAYEASGWAAVTPQRVVGFDSMMLPQADLLENYSRPIRHKFGMAAADRIVLVGDPTEPASITWSSNQPGMHTVLSASTGGGIKVLSSGNIDTPTSVVLWQNPQSVDTLTVLCSSEAGATVSYYMQPAQVQTSNTGTSAIMGFEETTSTPGCLSPYGAEVLNNALYRPLDMSLIKSTASNYNINHKVMSEQIADRWRDLLDKDRVVSAQLDNRLYYLVHNPHGEVLRDGCNGNEIWVLDISAEQGHWSRYLIQASALAPVNVAGGVHMAVMHPGGISYLDKDYRFDDQVDIFGNVVQRNIPWRMETNLQGANRAHDAWAHLQQGSVFVGQFHGTFEWGVKGYDVNGRWIDARKRTEVPVPLDDALQWQFEDPLLVRRDMKEWYFHASSVPGEHSSGEVLMVQYRYTPVTVNVGYEGGSVETFEYGSGAEGYARDGVVQPTSDAGRSWT